jgi:NAD+ synthase (glutamine-hydrolysing)
MRGNIITVATCNLNQWALDFTGNFERILQSCVEARAAGASYRLGPELEICGYGAEDHFLEVDTFQHCWESLSELVDRGAASHGLLCDFGMPILHGGVRYNARVLVLDKQILMIRPKTALADSGNYRESRYFTAYKAPSLLNGGSIHQETFLLPKFWQEKYGQSTAPFGIRFLQFADGITVGCESCEELWTPQATHIDMALSGVEIIGNGSGSHHELRKLETRLELIINATKKCGGVYLYANQRGCDGGRLYFDGCAMIVFNGKVLAQAKQFDVQDVETISATIDLDDVRSYRASIPSFGIQSAQYSMFRQAHLVYCKDLSLGNYKNIHGLWPSLTQPIQLRIHSAEEECCLGPACWLWDYLRRSNANGFFLPLSGGADSSAVATIVGCLCQLVTQACQADPTGKVASECRRVCQMQDSDPLWIPETAQDMANVIFHTAYMGTSNSSTSTNARARLLGQVIGSYHLSINIDQIISAIVNVFAITTGKTPIFRSLGGSTSEDLALQNIQARSRMVTSYLFAQLLPWVRGKSGFLLVLGSANVDEGLRGYLTKYDCSSADLNPIGGISKQDLKRMLTWAANKYNYGVLNDIVNAQPTAELVPIQEGGCDGDHSQSDEADMGMTYEELGYFGRLRKLSRCGPVSM